MDLNVKLWSFKDASFNAIAIIYTCIINVPLYYDVCL